jgi:uncharacterized membrane protein
MDKRAYVIYFLISIIVVTPVVFLMLNWIFKLAIDRDPTLNPTSVVVLPWFITLIFLTVMIFCWFVIFLVKNIKR